MKKVGENSRKRGDSTRRSSKVDAHAPSALAAALLEWFDRAHRALPWRLTRDPYRILLSEVMLQQTQVATVVERYRRFLERFPTERSVASATAADLRAEWSGLGYYRRAELLHRCLQEIVARGEFPGSAEALRELPGIGPYTAAAVASIAFDEVVPAIDGNVERVVLRLLAEDSDPRIGSTRRRLQETALELLDPARPGASNQALMELGATVCRPTRTACESCPLRPRCRAFASGEPLAWPVRRPRRSRVRRWRLVVVVEAGGSLLLVRRPRTAPYLGGIWELPGIEGEGAEPPRDRQAAAAIRDELGLTLVRGGALARVRHAITYRDLEVEVRRGRLARAGLRIPDQNDGARFFDRAEIGVLATSSLLDKCLRALEAAERGSSAGTTER